MSGHVPDKIDVEIPVATLVLCAQDRLHLAVFGDANETRHRTDPMRLSVIVEPSSINDSDDEGKTTLWLDRNDALHLADVLRMWAISTERASFQESIIRGNRKREKEPTP